jgi:hypothetical protein
MASMNYDERATHIIANTAMAFYLGECSSAEASRDMDRALLSWNYDPAMLNASRELFDAVLDAAMDYDLMEQAREPRIGHWSDAEWDRVFADLDRVSTRDLTIG